MRTLKYLGLTVLLVPSLVISRPSGKGSAPEPGPQFKFTAVPISASFAEGEKVMYEFKIQNQSASTVLVSPLFVLNYDVYLKVSDAHGRDVPWCGVVAKYVFLKAQFARLGPGKTLSVRREISCDRPRGAGFSIVGPGGYSVSATYRFPVPKEMRDHAGGIPFASGDHVSDPSRFTIVAKSARN